MENLNKPEKLTGLINYQKGAVVSRTIIDKPSGTITLFAFDKDQGLSEHAAPFDALVNIIDGEAEIKIGEEPHVVKPGELIVLPANKPHEMRAITEFKMMLTMIRQQ